ncbi:MAG: hypothetical protein GX455_12130 [Phycisphaerae bacterium]|nr:hypothetical protein [Phycisphaerae bacterium]
MKRWELAVLLMNGLACTAMGEEKLDRALVAVQRDDGKALLSWRMLKGDSADATTEIHRTNDNTKDSPILITETPCKGTCYVDAGVKIGHRYTYRLYLTGQDKPLSPANIELFEEARP